MNRRLTEVDYVTVPELAKITELDNRTVRKFLNGLVAQGKLIAEGNTRVGVIGRDSGRDISMQWDSLKGYGKYDS